MGNACSSAWSNLLPAFLSDLCAFTAVYLTFAPYFSASGVFLVVSIFFQSTRLLGLALAHGGSGAA